jgi:hypothetical protein
MILLGNSKGCRGRAAMSLVLLSVYLGYRLPWGFRNHESFRRSRIVRDRTGIPLPSPKTHNDRQRTDRGVESQKVTASCRVGWTAREDGYGAKRNAAGWKALSRRSAIRFAACSFSTTYEQPLAKRTGRKS